MRTVIIRVGFVLLAIVLLLGVVVPQRVQAAGGADEQDEAEQSPALKRLVERLPANCVVIRTRVGGFDQNTRPDENGLVQMYLRGSTTLVAQRGFTPPSTVVGLTPAAVDKIASYPGFEFILVQTRGSNVVGVDDVISVKDVESVLRAINEYTAASYAAALPPLQEAVKADPEFALPVTQQALSKAISAAWMDEMYGDQTRKSISLDLTKDLLRAAGVTLPFPLSEEAGAARKAMGDAILRYEVRSGYQRIVQPTAEEMEKERQDYVRKYGAVWESRAVFHRIAPALDSVLTADETIASMRARFRKPDDPALVDPQGLYVPAEGTRRELLQYMLDRIFSE